jgi:hypothetical protein
MNLYFLLALVSLVLWGVLAFGIAVPTGWVHVPLILGVVLIAVGIVESSGKPGSK